MHPIEVCGDFQRRLVPGLGDIEPHVQATADAEDQEDEEAEVTQMLLERTDVDKTFVSEAFDLNSPLPVKRDTHFYQEKNVPTTMTGKSIPSRNRPVQLRVQAMVNAADLNGWVKSSPGRGAITPAEGQEH